MRGKALWAGLFALALPLVPAAYSQIAPDTIRLDQPAAQGRYVRGWAPPNTIRLTLDGAAIPLAADGRFAIGFGRDAGPDATLIAQMRDGESVQQPIPVAPRRWKIENLPTLPRWPQPSAEFAARRPAELAQIEAARQQHSQSSGWRGRFIWPAKGRISGVFGSQRIYAGEPGAPHNGVDIAGGSGAPVIAPADGVIVLAAQSPFTLEGHLVMIDHGMGLSSALLHLSRIDVKLGDVVTQGQPIGAIGMTGRATGPHLHWGLRWRDVRLDPAELVGE